MPKGKKLPSKKQAPGGGKKAEPVKGVEEHEEEKDLEGHDVFPAKEKVVPVIEIEERDDIVGPVDKMVADPLLEADAISVDGAETEELGLDEEEIDPFGDKWEA